MKTVYIAGDSTAAHKLDEKRPETGWGEKIPLFFDDTVHFENHAVNGRSTKSFIAEGRLEEIKKAIQKNDYLLIQFGHNDQKIEDPERGTAPFGDYLANLDLFVNIATEAGAKPVLLTPISRRNYLDDGSLNSECLGQYPAAVRQFAAERSLPLLDLFSASQKWLSQFEPEKTRQFFLQGKPGELPNYPDGVMDNTHLNEKGATEIARLVAQAIKKSELDLKNALL